MKRFIHHGGLTLCAAAVIFSVAGCSRNVATQSEVEVAENPAPVTAMAPPSPQQLPAATKKATAMKSITWESSFEGALKKARATQKPIMIDFYATWCGPCKILDEHIYPTPEVTEEAVNFVSLKVDVDKQQQLAGQFKVESLPTIIFLDASGKVIHRVEGITSAPSDFVQTMQTARSQITATPA